MRRVAILPLAIAVVALAGCGGSKPSSGSPGSSTTASAPTPTRPLTQLDLINIIGTTPDTPANSDYADSGSNTIALADLRRQAQTSGEKATVAAFAKAGFKLIYQRSFNGAVNTADATAYLFGGAAGGAKGFSVLEGTLEKPGGVSQRVTPVKVQGLGDEAWAAHLTGGSEGAVFLWRRGSLVVVADMSCDQSCTGVDIVAATRAYAEAIDQRAKATP